MELEIKVNKIYLNHFIVFSGENTDEPPPKNSKATPWYNANTYECLKCGWLGSFDSVDRHIRQGLNSIENLVGLSFSSKVT